MKDKSGKKITIKEFFSRWYKGIKNVATNPTPIERLNQESYATFVMLIGYLSCLIVLIVFRERFFVNWFAYALILIFLGNLWSSLLKFIGIKQSLKLLKGSKELDIKESINKLNEIFNEDEKVELNEEKKVGMSSGTMNIKKYTNSKEKAEVDLNE